MHRGGQLRTIRREGGASIRRQNVSKHNIVLCALEWAISYYLVLNVWLQNLEQPGKARQWQGYVAYMYRIW